jgi:hypothetical protein
VELAQLQALTPILGDPLHLDPTSLQEQAEHAAEGLPEGPPRAAEGVTG